MICENNQIIIWTRWYVQTSPIKISTVCLNLNCLHYQRQKPKGIIYLNLKPADTCLIHSVLSLIRNHLVVVLIFGITFEFGFWRYVNFLFVDVIRFLLPVAVFGAIIRLQARIFRHALRPPSVDKDNLQTCTLHAPSVDKDNQLFSMTSDIHSGHHLWIKTIEYRVWLQTCTQVNICG